MIRMGAIDENAKFDCLVKQLKPHTAFQQAGTGAIGVVLNQLDKSTAVLWISTVSMFVGRIRFDHTYEGQRCRLIKLHIKPSVLRE